MKGLPVRYPACFWAARDHFRTSSFVHHRCWFSYQPVSGDWDGSRQKQPGTRSWRNHLQDLRGIHHKPLVVWMSGNRKTHAWACFAMSCLYRRRAPLSQGIRKPLPRSSQQTLSLHLLEASNHPTNGSRE